MIAIKGMTMPNSCADCPMSYLSGNEIIYCHCILGVYGINDIDWAHERHENCPLVGDIEEQPTVNQWTPCSEQLPKERERVLVYIDRPANQICVSQRTDVTYWIGLGHVNVVAWQPLPKPYECEEDDYFMSVEEAELWRD